MRGSQRSSGTKLGTDLAFVQRLVEPGFFFSIEPLMQMGDLVSIAHCLRYLFLNRWRNLAAELQEKRYVLFACSEQRFVESLFAIAEREFAFAPAITLNQFYQPGFGQARLGFLKSFVDLCEGNPDQVPRAAAKQQGKRAHGGMEKWVTSPRSPSLYRRKSDDEWMPGDSSPQRYLAVQSSRESGDDLSELSFPDASTSSRFHQPPPSSSSSQFFATSTNTKPSSSSLLFSSNHPASLGRQTSSSTSSLPPQDSSTELRLSRLETTLHSEISRIEYQLQRLTALISEKYSPPISPSSTSTDTAFSRLNPAAASKGLQPRWQQE